ncbi:LysE family transporter [Saccharospirillum sp. HFRX-1]|uniref:LysE family translocator n=1 Tax=unclassified Saccharospirillum TaxID=2633430 RepID=UPI0037172633
MADIHYWLIISAALIACASPGPATLAISSTALSGGRPRALAVAAGIWSGSLVWSVSAAFGLSAIMLANAWLFEIFRYLGAGYLLYLSYRSFRSMLQASMPVTPVASQGALLAAYRRGLLIHLTNPKAVLFFGALYSLMLSPNTAVISLLSVIAVISCTNAVVFFGYAVLFSNAKIRRGYDQSRRFFDAVFAGFFAFAGLKLWVSRIND